MRLLYVENSLVIYGGVERVLVDKLNWLAEYGDCEVSLLTVDQSSHPVVFQLHDKVHHHDLDIQFYQIYRYSGWRRFRGYLRLRKLFRQRLAEKVQEYPPHVIVCTRLDMLGDVVRACGRQIPVVFESHSSFRSYQFENEPWFRKLKYFYFHRAVRKVQKVVALTKGDAMEWKKMTPNVEVIPDVVHLNDTGRVSNVRAKSAIFVGRFSYQKDIDTLLLIWKNVSKHHPDWQLHVFGGYGNDQERMLSEISRMPPTVILHEPTPTMNEEYLKCSMLLMTSRFEPFGLVLPEAMSCGLPVVAFNCPYGPADIITDGVDGFLIEGRDIDVYADKVCRLMEDDDLRLKMGKAGLLSSQRYRTEIVMPLWLKMFEQIIN